MGCKIGEDSYMESFMLMGRPLTSIALLTTTAATHTPRF